MSTLTAAQIIDLIDGDDPAFYTGIGSRETPAVECSIMGALAKYLAQRNRVLRSGGAMGADGAFEYGCDQVAGAKEIFIPWSPFNGRDSIPKLIISLEEVSPELYTRAYDIASKVHPAWLRCTEPAKMLHIRNVFQVLGRDLQHPSSFVVCWTEFGKDKGGTATAIKLARQYGIPVLNLGIDQNKSRLMSALSQIRGGLMADVLPDAQSSMELE